MTSLLDTQVDLAEPSFRYRRPPREIDGLLWASWIKRNPHKGIRLKGAAARGKAYEGRCTKWVSETQAPQGKVLKKDKWIQFEDMNGLGHAQPDIVLDYQGEDLIFLIECKLTHHEFAHVQLRDLYEPLLSHIYPEREFMMIEMCHSLGTGTKFPGPVVNDWNDILAQSGDDLVVFHWPG